MYLDNYAVLFLLTITSLLLAMKGAGRRLITTLTHKRSDKRSVQ